MLSYKKTKKAVIKKGSEHNIGNVAERNLAKRLKGRPTVSSGAKEHDKGDVDLGNYLLECKATEAASISIKLDWLAKISRESLCVNKLPALAIQFMEDGRLHRNGSWVMIREDDFNDYLSYLELEEDQ